MRVCVCLLTPLAAPCLLILGWKSGRQIKMLVRKQFSLYIHWKCGISRFVYLNVHTISRLRTKPSLIVFAFIHLHNARVFGYAARQVIVVTHVAAQVAMWRKPQKCISLRVCAQQNPAIHTAHQQCDQRSGVIVCISKFYHWYSRATFVDIWYGCSLSICMLGRCGSVSDWTEIIQVFKFRTIMLTFRFDQKFHLCVWL